MTTADAYARTRINKATKQRPHETLKGVPNQETKEAIAELRDGKGKAFDSVDALMADLNADD